MNLFTKSFVTTFILFPLIVFGQNYEPMVKEGATWINVRFYSDIPNLHGYHTEKLWINDSTNYLGNKYYYLFRGSDSTSNSPNYNNADLIREDSLGKVFIVRNYNGQRDSLEYLLYNFGIKVGDTIFPRRFNIPKDSGKYVLWKIDTISISGHERKRYHFAVDYSLVLSDIWIESIGSIDWGFFSTYNIIEGPGYQHEYIGCFWDDEIYWRADSSKSCEFLSVAEGSTSLKSISIFPNPTSGIIHLSEIKRDQTYEVLNTEGRLIKKGEFKENDFIDIRNAPPGLYFVRILDGNSSFCLKIMKE